jgi:hypothetical protein
MKIVPTWQENELVDKEIRSCDNKEVGHAKKNGGNMITSVKGMKSLQIPTEAIAAFDGEKVYLRATEAEVLAGVYPFVHEENCDCECHTETITSPGSATTTIVRWVPGEEASVNCLRLRKKGQKINFRRRSKTSQIYLPILARRRRTTRMKK